MTYNTVTITGSNAYGNAAGQRVRVKISPVAPYFDTVNNVQVSPKPVETESGSDGSWSLTGLVDPTPDNSGIPWLLQVSIPASGALIYSETVQVAYSQGSTQGWLSLTPPPEPANQSVYVISPAGAPSASGEVLTSVEAGSNQAQWTVFSAQYSLGWFVVTEYGADPTGGTDSTSAIQAAINAASAVGGGIVWVPPGNYHVSGTLNIPSFVTLAGSGSAGTGGTGTTLTMTAMNINLLSIAGTSGTLIQGVTVSGLTLTGPGQGSGSTGYGIHMSYANDSVVISNVLVWQHGSHGVYMTNSYGISWRDCWFTANGGHGFYGLTSVNVVSWERCLFDSNGLNGCLIDGGAGSAFWTCDFESNFRHGLEMRYCYATGVYNSDLESNGTDGTSANVLLAWHSSASDKCQGVTVRNCNITGASITVNGVKVDGANLARVEDCQFTNHVTNDIVTTVNASRTWIGPNLHTGSAAAFTDGSTSSVVFDYDVTNLCLRAKPGIEFVESTPPVSNVLGLLYFSTGAVFSYYDGTALRSIATTATVTAAVAAEAAARGTSESLLAPLISPGFSGTPTAPTASPLTSSTQLATTAYGDAAVLVEKNRATTAEGLLAPKASPGFTGTPTTPNAAALTNNTQVANTAYADAAVAVETARALAAEAVLGGGAMPADYGLQAWNGDPVMWIAVSSATTAGTAYVAKIMVRSPRTISQLAVVISNAPSMGAGSGAFLALYNAAGTQIGVTSDQSTVWNAAGLYTPSIGSQNLTVQAYYVLMIVGAVASGATITTAPATPVIQLAAGGSGIIESMNLVGTAPRWGTAGAALTAVPSSISPSSLGNTGVKTNMFWAGLK